MPLVNFLLITSLLVIGVLSPSSAGTSHPKRRLLVVKARPFLTSLTVHTTNRLKATKSSTPKNNICHGNFCSRFFDWF